jgi:AcrR family transcriptional regulator
VAAAAGFSKRTVYLYFKNKDDLFLTLAEEGMALAQHRLEAIPVDAQAIEESMAAVLQAYMWFAQSHAAYYRIIFQEADADMIRRASPEVRRRLEQRERACIGVVARIAERALAEGLISGVDPWGAAVIFWSATAGILMLSQGVSQTAFTTRTKEELIEKAVWTLFAGLRAQAPAVVADRSHADARATAMRRS